MSRAPRTDVPSLRYGGSRGANSLSASTSFIVCVALRPGAFLSSGLTNTEPPGSIQSERLIAGTRNSEPARVGGIGELRCGFNKKTYQKKLKFLDKGQAEKANSRCQAVFVKCRKQKARWWR